MIRHYLITKICSLLKFVDKRRLFLDIILHDQVTSNRHVRTTTIQLEKQMILRKNGYSRIQENKK